MDGSYLRADFVISGFETPVYVTTLLVTYTAGI